MGDRQVGILAPQGLPSAIVQRLTTAFAEVLRDDGFLREGVRLLMTLRPLIGEEFRRCATLVGCRIRALWEVSSWKE